MVNVPKDSARIAGNEPATVDYYRFFADLNRFVGNVSPFMLTVLDDTTAVLALTTLGIEVGTWTPAMTFATPGTSSFAYGFQQGNYLKVSNVYFVRMAMSVTPTVGTGSGNVRVSLPATNGGRVSTGYVTELSADWTWGAGFTQIIASIPASVAYTTLRKLGTGTNSGALDAADMVTGNSHNVSFTAVMFT